MRKARHILGPLIAVLATGGPSQTWAEETFSHAEIAAQHCPAEWSALATLQPDAWAAFGTVEDDPDVDSAHIAAFNKYTAAAIALADYFGSLIGLPNAVAQDPASFDVTRARFALTQCLMPTVYDRGVVMAFSRLKEPGMPDDVLEKALFEGFDLYECMRAPEASEQIFALDPMSASFAEDHQAIMLAIMVPCT
ncbi:hypothetical protein [uncultured Tateyamaria sp.]|uniref:hypothetical protein n=1 Tax=uncultured Tateyamaria sp. TaxID=455651 RepID=UPI002612BBA0|nr:hypothetical protein [uncultured Tateyamaria sp.]